MPAVLRIHGGPTDQFSTAFELEWQVLAGHGYAVIAANPRGSTGRGTAYSRAIWADWGNKDYEDVMAAVDHVVGTGVADPDRLGVGGWSYGGILTDYVITKTTRFKAAVSGASIANYLAGYGTDHYQCEYEVELGLPWKARDLWLGLSSPFFDVEKVTTPTLFLCGALDMNVPLLNSEQLYQALRRVGRVETELVVYPDQWHGIETPSYRKDRWERYLAWYDRFLRTAAPPRTTASRRRRRSSASRSSPPPCRRRRARAWRRAWRRPPPTSRRRRTASTRPSPSGAATPPSASTARRSTSTRAPWRSAPTTPASTATVATASSPSGSSTRRVADLTRAAQLVEGRPDEPEPDSDPSRPPSTTLQFSVFYHLGLAHYLKGDFAAAEKAYRRCLERARGSDDRLVSATDWLYMTLRRLGRTDDATRLLEPIHAGLDVKQDRSYLNRLLMYKGIYAPEDLLRAGGDPLTRDTYGYAVGNWYLYNGRKDEARAAFERVVASPQWPAFGHVAAEADLARMK